MKRLTNSIESAKIDKLAQQKYHLTSDILMEAVGALSAQLIVSQFFETPSSVKQKIPSEVLIICGPGHNGGDGLVLARYLHAYQIPIQVWVSDPSTSLVKKQQKYLQYQNIPFYFLRDFSKLKKKLKPNSLIVDALFGVGLNRSITGVYHQVIKWVNNLPAGIHQGVISLDLPSGLNIDTGQINKLAIRASKTFTFGLSKVGFYLQEGPSLTGDVQVLPIGFPHFLLEKVANTYFLVDKSWVSLHLPQRKATDHKAKQGHLLVLAGSPGFWGAGGLCTLSAYRMGCGYVTWAGEGEKGQAPPFYSAGSKTKSITDLEYKDICPDVLTQTLNHLDHLILKKTAVVIGPGLRVGEVTKKLLLFLKKTKLPVLVDASAILVCIKENLFPLPAHWVLTPHSGELGQMFGVKGREVDRDRCAYAMKASQKTGCLVLLKGFYSVLAQGTKCWIIPTGNSALAKAGTGDALAGFIGALMARRLPPLEAALVASFVHGKIADEWVKSGKDLDTLMAQDLKDLLPSILHQLRNK